MPAGFVKRSATMDQAGNNQIVLRSADGKSVLRTLTSTTLAGWRLVFSPDGRLLASTDGMDMRIWRVDDGKLLLALRTECP